MAWEPKQWFMTENDCYKEARPMTPRGIVVHSTGANNPYLLRYVQPDDGALGVNRYNNSWNRAGVEVSVHAMIGRLYDDTVACYQLLPWNIACWGVGRGSKGSYNYDPTGHIQFEICEDALDDAAYFGEVFDTAATLCAYLCRMWGLTADDIVSHAEAGKAGYGSRHGDPDHWLKKFGRDMDWFRAAVRARLAEESRPETAGTAFRVGETVRFLGGPHYTGANSREAAGNPAAGPAQVTVVAEGALHPYHVVHTDGTSGVYGWVDADRVAAAEAPAAEAAEALRQQVAALQGELRQLQAEASEAAEAIGRAMEALRGAEELLR